MSLPNTPTGVATPRTVATQSQWDAAESIVGTLGAFPSTLGSFGVTEQDRNHLIAHLGRKSFQGSPTRNFKAAWRKDKDGNTVPNFYRVGTDALARCQYVMLTHKQYAAVIVIDVDRRGTYGGTIESLHTDVRTKLGVLAAGNLGPSWIGVNPFNGKCQLIWLIDPVYADGNGHSRNIRLLKVTMSVLADYLGGDQAFAHRLSRSPFFTGDDPTAYKWHVQHHRVDKLSNIRKGVGQLTGQKTPEPDQEPKQQFTSGRDLINAVRTRREEAEAARKLFSSLENDLPDAEALDGNRIDGVKVLWISDGCAARDETAFRHALAVAHRLREAGERMTDAKIIDAYDHAYNVAQAVGAANREPELPPTRDRMTMARRVRGYVLSNGRKKTGTNLGGNGSATAQERKALATMGRKGGQKAAERWNDRNSEYAQAELKKLRKTQERKKAKGRSTRSRISQFVNDQYIETGVIPTWNEIMKEVSASRRTVAYHMSALKKQGEIPEI